MLLSNPRIRSVMVLLVPTQLLSGIDSVSSHYSSLYSRYNTAFTFDWLGSEKECTYGEKKLILL